MTTVTRTVFTPRFVELPPNTGRGRTNPSTDFAVADACRSRPGEWAELPLSGRKINTLSQNVRKGCKAFPTGQFEFTQRGGKAYVRYAG